METTYKIVRLFQRGERQVIKRGLTLEEAREHCNDPETSWKTCTTQEGMELTKLRGEWFDAYYSE